MIRVSIDMDQTWTFWPDKEGETLARLFPKKPTMEISDELFAEYQELLPKWIALQEKFEQLYRDQEGLAQWSEAPIPERVRL